MNQTCFTQNEKIPLENTNHKSGGTTLVSSPVYTQTRTHTHVHFIREVNDTIITCPTTTMHAEMFPILLYFLKVFHGMMIHKNNAWAQHGFVGWSQCPKAKIKKEDKFVWISLILSWSETCFRLCSNYTWNYASWMQGRNPPFLSFHSSFHLDILYTEVPHKSQTLCFAIYGSLESYYDSFD